MAIYGWIVVSAVVVFSAPMLSRSADLFRWIDEKGVVHFTDNPHNIPEKYRAGSSRIKAKEPPKEQRGSSFPGGKTVVPLQTRGAIVTVSASVNDRLSLNLVVDTGATYTMISRAAATSLGIDLEAKLPTASFRTANGVIHAPIVALQSVEVGGMRVLSLEAAVHDVFEDSAISGLLGLNFLGNFRMDIDTGKGVLVLEKRP
jgi:clan AA aspartic protease (TIGR02281 family)